MSKIKFTAIFSLFFINILLINNAMAVNSVLSSGTWYKMAVSSSGMYSISYDELAAMGVDVASINPKKIRLFHNGGGIVPALNNEPRIDDLNEIPILIYGEEDGHFDANDLIVFYAHGPVSWQFDSDNNFYEHVKNPYSDYAYVFMTIGDADGKRITTDSNPTTYDVAVDEFIDAQTYDVDEFNLNNMGRTWYCDKFDVTLSRDYAFSFPNIVKSRMAKMRSEVATRNSSSITFKYSVNGEVVTKISLGAMGSTQYTYAQTASTYVKSFDATSENLNLNLTFSRTGSASVGWLNYIEMCAWRKLQMNGDVMAFRNPECSDPTIVYQYCLSNATSSVQVWDVTNPASPMKMNATLNGNVLKFNAKGGDLKEFIAFNNGSFAKTTFIGTVANQNLHAKKDIDYLIIAHPNFVSHAQRLKEIHSDLDSLVIEIVEPQLIYNEFSCGALDIAGIRDFIKMLYENSSEEHKLKYVLLFGDASYAYKNSEVCFIPSYESVASCSITANMVTDDFYACLGPEEGNMEDGSSIIDIAIGRMPVSTTEQATGILDKLEQFIAKNEYTMNKWRNVMTLVCDDEESGGHFLKNSEFIADSIAFWGGDMIVDKIYLDAYTQVATASGQRCPEVNEAITNRIENGTLIMNYVGHGGEVGWSEERILTNDDINSLKNMPMLPIFLTATCEFSRFDDHTRTSAGELLFLNSKGGAINMVTTARTTNGSASMELVKRFYRNVFKMYGGEYQRIGDIYLAAKQGKEYQSNTKRYTLFGDPALRIAYPKNNVVLTKINGNDVSQGVNDTLKALSYCTLEGEVRDNFGCVMTDFNGIVQVSIFDKENTYFTNGDHGYTPAEFELRDSYIFNGKAEVENGKFFVDFRLPKDIKYDYGNGLISFYTTDYQTDANGSFSNFIVGGYDETVTLDVDGPEVRAYIDDTLFVSGGITNENPVLYAKIRDINGINTTGSGIGHDLCATLTGATNKTYNLNNYYETPLNIYEWGNLSYKLYGLNEGQHELKLKVWDIFNNSTTVTLTFNVLKSNNLAVENLCNVPNPMSSFTNIMFEYNQKDAISVCVRIFNISGQLVRTIETSRDGNSLRIEPIVWDGTNSGGTPLPSGVYIYNVTVSTSNNEKATDYSKLVITR